jgi:hypothetical protein
MPAKGGKTEMVVGFRGTETESAKGQVADVFTDLFALQSHISKMEGIPKDRYDKSVEVGKSCLRSAVLRTHCSARSSKLVPNSCTNQQQHHIYQQPPAINLHVELWNQPFT